MREDLAGGLVSGKDTSSDGGLADSEGTYNIVARVGVIVPSRGFELVRVLEVTGIVL